MDRGSVENRKSGVIIGVPEIFPQELDGRLIVIGQQETFSCGNDPLIARMLAAYFNASSFSFYATAEAGMHALNTINFGDVGAVVVQDRLRLAVPAPLSADIGKDTQKTYCGAAFLKAHGAEWPVPQFLVVPENGPFLMRFTPFNHG